MDTVAPLAKFDPVMLTPVDPPGQPVSGDIDVTTGAERIRTVTGER